MQTEYHAFVDGDAGRCGAILRQWSPVKSDWCGAQSFLVDDLDAVCAGLDSEVVASIRQFAQQTIDHPADQPRSEAADQYWN